MSKWTRFEARFPQLVIRYRWPIIVASIVLIALAAAGTRHLAFTNSYRTYFEPTDPNRVALDLVENTYTKEIFLNIDATDVGSGLLKSTVFGMIIAYAGCLRGMNCDTSSTGVGRATTSAVVTSLLLIIIFNSIFAVIYSIYNI